MPCATASALKRASQASKLPEVRQSIAAVADVAAKSAAANAQPAPKSLPYRFMVAAESFETRRLSRFYHSHNAGVTRANRGAQRLRQHIVGHASHPRDTLLRDACGMRQDRCGDSVVDAMVVLIDSKAELARARAFVGRLWDSSDPADMALLEAQALLIAAYEERKWPRRPPKIADLLRHLMDQHSLTRADMVPLLGTPSRVSEVLRGKKGLSMAMVQRLRARFGVPADLLLPPPKKASPRHGTKRAAA
jgi:HTH-type transcriptional regulator/antitoxin HigA